MSNMHLTKTDLIALGKGLIITVIGAVLTYGTQWVSGMDFGVYTPWIVTGWAFVVNVVRKYIDTPVEKATGVQL